MILDFQSPALSLFIGAGLGCFVVLVFFIRFLVRFFRRPELLGMSRADILKRWRKIERLAHEHDDTSYTLAVLEADKLLDHALKSMGFGGTSLGERLKLAAYKYPRLRSVWHAHSIRNRMVHEASFHLSRSQARQAVSGFRRALEQLGIL